MKVKVNKYFKKTEIYVIYGKNIKQRTLQSKVMASDCGVLTLTKVCGI